MGYTTGRPSLAGYNTVSGHACTHTGTSQSQTSLVGREDYFRSFGACQFQFDRGKKRTIGEMFVVML